MEARRRLSLSPGWPILGALAALALGLGWLVGRQAAVEPRGPVSLSPHPSAADPLAPHSIRRLLTDAAGWQLAHPQRDPRDWTNAAFYMGLMAASEATGNDAQRQALLQMGEANRWRPGDREAHADDHAIAQVYLDLYRHVGDSRAYRPFQETVETWMTSRWADTAAHRPIAYWWCDALFMSPPALAKLAVVTGETRYLDHLDRLWEEAHELLYEPRERLFYRDLREREPPVFWARGNGWVLAGIARLLAELPQDRPARSFYEALFREMAVRIAELQHEDGLWRSNLLGVHGDRPGESSGTALFTYALAWGINAGLLDEAAFAPVVRRGWTGLVGEVDENGRLGSVQAIGRGPGPVAAADTENYGVGGLLLAGSEVLKLVESERGPAL